MKYIYIYTILTPSLVSCPFERALDDDSRTLRRVYTGVFIYLHPKHPKAGKGKGEIELISDSDIASERIPSESIKKEN